MDTKMLAKDKVGLNGVETVLVSILFFFLLFFADIVQIRSAFLTRVMGDADCFFRAGWAAKVGKSIYEVTDPNGWHYNYPPLFAIAMILCEFSLIMSASAMILMIGGVVKELITIFVG